MNTITCYVLAFTVWVFAIISRHSSIDLIVLWISLMDFFPFISRTDKREILYISNCSTWIEEVKELLNRLYLKHIDCRTFWRIFLHYKLRNNLKKRSLLMLCIKKKITIENFGIYFVCILRHGARVYNEREKKSQSLLLRITWFAFRNLAVLSIYRAWFPGKSLKETKFSILLIEIWAIELFKSISRKTYGNWNYQKY